MPFLAAANFLVQCFLDVPLAYKVSRLDLPQVSLHVMRVFVYGSV